MGKSLAPTLQLQRRMSMPQKVFRFDGQPNREQIAAEFMDGTF
jgi:hypothetical protein